MENRPQAFVAAAWAQLAGLAVLLVSAMWFRRPDQFSHPYIWVEDGTRNLPDFIAGGWSFVLDPIVGYISLPIRLLFGIAATVSFRWLPEIAFALALLFSYLVLVAVALSPTALRYRFLCAAALLVLPTNPEVYAVSLYSGWWGSVLALLPLLWPARSDDHVWLRGVLLTAGGLSTPLCIGLWPLYALRFAVWRLRSDGTVLIVATLVAALQAATMWMTFAEITRHPAAGALTAVPVKFFAFYVYATNAPIGSRRYYVIAAGLFGLLAAAVTVRRRTICWPVIVALLAAMAVAIAGSAARAPLTVMHPTLAGGRYFFLPYLLLSWLLLYLIDRQHRVTSALCAGALLLSVVGFAAHGRWRHAAIDWRAHVDQCASEASHVFPVHYEGTQAHGISWQVEVPGDACRALVVGSLFDNDLGAPATVPAPAR